MKARTIATHIDGHTSDRFLTLVQTENRTPSQILNVAVKQMIDYSPGARRAVFAIDGIADEKERAFAAKAFGRTALQVYEAILDGRRASLGQDTGSNTVPDTEDAIEAEAVRMCRA